MRVPQGATWHRCTGGYALREGDRVLAVILRIGAEPPWWYRVTIGGGREHRAPEPGMDAAMEHAIALLEAA